MPAQIGEPAAGIEPNAKIQGRIAPIYCVETASGGCARANDQIEQAVGVGAQVVVFLVQACGRYGIGKNRDFCGDGLIGDGAASGVAGECLIVDALREGAGHEGKKCDEEE